MIKRIIMNKLHMTLSDTNSYSLLIIDKYCVPKLPIAFLVYNWIFVSNGTNDTESSLAEFGISCKV